MTSRDMEDGQWIDDKELIEELAEEETTERPVNRRTNIHKKKKKKHRKNRKLWILPVLLVVIAVIGLTVFRVKNLKIEGNSRVSDEVIKELIHWDACQGNTLLLWVMNRKVDVSSDELLSGIKVSIVNPQTVRVRVEEQLLVGCIRIGEQYFYINNEGTVVQSRTDKLSEVPLLEGLEVEKAETGTALKAGSDEVLNDMLDIAEYLESYEVPADTIEQAAEAGYMIRMGNVKILLGRNIYIEEKISELKDLLPEIEELSGTLHLEDYDSTKDSIIFTKDS